MDKHKLSPGDHWPEKIEEAILNSDFFLVCLSSNLVTKQGFFKKGHFQDEIQMARDIWWVRSKFIWLPVRLKECKVPEELSHLQWVDLYKKSGLLKLIKNIRAAIKDQARKKIVRKKL